MIGEALGKVRELKWRANDINDDEALFFKYMARCLGDDMWDGKSFNTICADLGVPPVPSGLGFLTRFRDAILPALRASWVKRFSSREVRRRQALTDQEDNALGSYNEGELGDP